MDRQKTSYSVHSIIPAHPTSDGDGVKIQRVTGFNDARFSPFLMIDELKSDNRSDYIGGFPPHPHRGIETLTYMLNGHFQHRDHMGNVGELRSGGAQWMAAGKGVIHSEMPIMKDGELHGFQIWINQPARDKMADARYHDFQPETITEYTPEPDSLLRVIAGQIQANGQTLQGPLLTTGVPLVVADWRTAENNRLDLLLNTDHQIMVYVYRGEVEINGQTIHQGHLAHIDADHKLVINSLSDAGALILSGEPIHEPVVHYGPFVMNSEQEIAQAIEDYNSGKFSTY